MRSRSLWRRILRSLLMPCAVVLLLVCFATALNSLESGQSREDLNQLRSVLYRGCVACYATEGFYPPDIEYLEENYGIHIDKTRYQVNYQVFAENLMPNITIVELEAKP